MAYFIDDPDMIKAYAMRTNLLTLELEIQGIKVLRGRSAYVRLKQLHNVKGSRRKVYKLLREKYIKLYPDLRTPREIN